MTDANLSNGHGNRDGDDGEREPRSGVIGFLRDTWMWWAIPIVLAVLAVVAVVYFSERNATSPFLYDSF